MIVSYERRYRDLQQTIRDMRAGTPDREPVAYGALTLLDFYSQSMDEIAEAAERVERGQR